MLRLITTLQQHQHHPSFSKYNIKKHVTLTHNAVAYNRIFSSTTASSSNPTKENVPSDAITTTKPRNDTANTLPRSNATHNNSNPQHKNERNNLNPKNWNNTTATNNNNTMHRNTNRKDVSRGSGSGGAGIDSHTWNSPGYNTNTNNTRFPNPNAQQQQKQQQHHANNNNRHWSQRSDHPSTNTQQHGNGNVNHYSSNQRTSTNPNQSNNGNYNTHHPRNNNMNQERQRQQQQQPLPDNFQQRNNNTRSAHSPNQRNTNNSSYTNMPPQRQQQQRIKADNNKDVNYSNDIESLRSIFLKSIEIDTESPHAQQQKDSTSNKKDVHKSNGKSSNTTSIIEEKDDLTAVLRSILLDSTKNAPRPPPPPPQHRQQQQEPSKSSWRTQEDKSFRATRHRKEEQMTLYSQQVTGVKPAAKSKVKKTKKKLKKTDVAPRHIDIPTNAYWSLKQVAQQLLVKALKIHKTLLSLDAATYANIAVADIRLDADTIELVVDELGHTSTRIQPSAEDVRELSKLNKKTGPVRPPVVCIMGHVDHGKTTLLDSLRSKSSPTSKSMAPNETGGITQIISAFQVNNVTFLDTPGHAAFSSMRKSSKAAMDILILVIDVKEGIQAQTKEIIELYAEEQRGEEEQSLIVAMTKVDRLSDLETEIEEYQYTIENQLVTHGIDLADIQFVPISSKTGYGLDDLIDAIEVQAQLMDLRASSSTANEFLKMEGIILEGRMEKGLGVVVDVVVRDGDTLKVGSTVLCFESGVYGRVKRLIDVNGKSIKQATPSQPVQIIGLKSIPTSGETIITVETEDLAKQILEKKLQEEEEEAAAAAAVSLSLLQESNAKAKENAAALDKEGVVKEEEEEKEESLYPIAIPIVLKADTHGSLSAIQDLIANILTDVKPQYQHMFQIKILSSSIGPITSNDIQLAQDSQARIYTFGASAYTKSSTAGLTANEVNSNGGVDIHQHSIIYKVIDDLQSEIQSVLPSTPLKIIHGSAIVQAIFNLNTKSKDVIAGLRILDGSFHRNIDPTSKLGINYQIKRKEEMIVDDLSTVTLRILKEHVDLVKKNEECGIDLGYKDYEKGDILECYSTEMKPMDIF